MTIEIQKILKNNSIKNKAMIKKFFTVILSICLTSGVAMAGSPQFDIECGGVTAKEGYYLVKVWVHSSKKAPDDMAIREAAVRGVLFRGVAPSEGCQSLRPIAGSQTSEDQHADYFNAFFNTEKKYLSYASIISGSYETEKLKKRSYRIGAKVMIAKDQLRRDLENAGIIRGLSTGF